MTDLDKLIEAVEAGVPFMSYHMGSNAIGYGMSVADAFEGSLDAALKLHEALLPGWTRDVDATAPECGIDVTLHAPGSNGVSKGTNDSEARAWLLAILRAYRSTQGEAG